MSNPHKKACEDEAVPDNLGDHIPKEKISSGPKKPAIAGILSACRDRKPDRISERLTTEATVRRISSLAADASPAPVQTIVAARAGCGQLRFVSDLTRALLTSGRAKRVFAISTSVGGLDALVQAAGLDAARGDRWAVWSDGTFDGEDLVRQLKRQYPGRRGVHEDDDPLGDPFVPTILVLDSVFHRIDFCSHRVAHMLATMPAIMASR